MAAGSPSAPKDKKKQHSEEELDSISVRVNCTIGEWRFGADGLEQVPQGLHEEWKSRCWASAVMPDMRPSKLLHEDKDGVQVWAVIDAKGNDVCTVVRYLRSYPSHVRAFEQHVELLLKANSVHIIKFAGAYATDTSVCLVLQPLSGSNFAWLVEMKQCGPLPEAFLSVTLRSILKSLQSLSSKGFVPSLLNVYHLWLGAESLKMGATHHFDWEPSDEARAVRMNDCIGSLPAIVEMISGIPKERLQDDGTEELWAPGGFYPDAKYAVLAASMWPLRFGKETDDRVHMFMEACSNPDNSLVDLLNHDLIVAYNHLPLDIVYSWFKVPGEYERFKYARSFSAQRIFAANAAKQQKKNKLIQPTESTASEAPAQEASFESVATDIDPLEQTGTDVLQGLAKHEMHEMHGVHIQPLRGHEGSMDPGGHEGQTATKQGSGKKAGAEEIIRQNDAMSDEELTKHLYDLFQESQKQGGNESLFKGLRGLQSFTEIDFGKLCQEFHILEKYRGAMTRTFGSPKQIRKKKGLAFQFQRPAKVATVYQPVPMSDTAKEVVRLSLHHWNSNMKGLKQRNKLRTYIQGTIWGRIGKNFSAKTFEEWHVIVMTKKLYDKREELRAIFGRDCVKRIFKCWVEYVFEEVEAPPVPGMTEAQLQARPKTRRRRHRVHQSHGDGRDSQLSSPQTLQVHTPQPTHLKSPTSGGVKLPEIRSATTPRASHSPNPLLPFSGGEEHVPSPPTHKRLQQGYAGSSPRHFQGSRPDDGTITQRADRLLLHGDRGVLIEEYRTEGFYIHQIGMIDVPPELRSTWKTKGFLEDNRNGLRLKEMQHRDPQGVEVWSIVDQTGVVTYSAAVYKRNQKEHRDLCHNHMRFLLAEWQTGAALEGCEPLGLLDAYVSGKHIYVVVEGFEQGNLSLLVRQDRLGPIPEPVLSVATRQMLQALAVIHSHGVACDGKMSASSFWLSRNGRLKLGPLFHFNIPDKKNMQYSISDDVHALLEVCVQLADARSEGSQMLARHELEFKIKQYEHKLNSLRKEKADIVKRQASAQSSGKQDKKQQMLDETRLAVLNVELNSTSDKLDEVRAQIDMADEAMRLFPLTYASSGRCHDFVAQAARPILTLGDIFHHSFVTSYLDVGAESLLRWVAVKGSGGKGNRLASTLYESDVEVQAEIDRVSKKPNESSGRKGSSMQEQQTAELNKIFQSYVVRGTGLDVVEHMDVNGLRRLVHDMFPGEGFSNEQIEDGFTLIDLGGSGKIVFSDFCEWWLGMKFSDKLGLRQQWKKELHDNDVRAAGELEERAIKWRTKNCVRRWRDRSALMSYYRFKGRIIQTKHNFGAVMDHVKAWRDMILGEDRTGPRYGKSAGSRLKAADRDSSRRKWGRSNGPELGEWEHGGAQTVENKRGISGRGSTPGGLITRSTALTPNPGNFAMRSPRYGKNRDPQSKQTHAPLSSPRNQRTNLKGPLHEFKRMSDSKYSDMSPTSTASNLLAATSKKSPTKS